MEPLNKKSSKIQNFINKFRPKNKKNVGKLEIDRVDTANTFYDSKKARKHFFSIFEKSEKLQSNKDALKSHTTCEKEILVEKINKEAVRKNLPKVEEELDFSVNLDDVSTLVMAPLNNFMAKSKIRAASKKKPSNIVKNLNKLIKESPDNLKIDKPIRRNLSDSSISIEENLKVAKFNSEIKINMPLLTTPKSTNKIAFSPSSEEIINTSSENVIEIVKKSLRNVKVTRSSNSSVNLIYSANVSPNQDQNKSKIHGLQPTIENRINDQGSILKPPINKQEASSDSIVNSQFLKPINESIRTALINSVDKVKTDSSTSVDSSSYSLKFGGSFISSGSSSSISEKIKAQIITHKSTEPKNKLLSPEQHIPIYDNFTMPFNQKPSIEKSVSAPDYFINNHNNKCDKKPLAPRNLDEELNKFISTKLRPIEKNTRSFEEMNKTDELKPKLSVKSIISDIDNKSDCLPSKKLVYSKSLLRNLDSRASNFQENRIDSINEKKTNEVKPMIVSDQALTKKIVLMAKNENINIPVKTVDIEIENLKRVSDLIKKFK